MISIEYPELLKFSPLDNEKHNISPEKKAAQIDCWISKFKDRHFLNNGK